MFRPVTPRNIRHRCFAYLVLRFFFKLVSLSGADRITYEYAFTKISIQVYPNLGTLSSELFYISTICDSPKLLVRFHYQR